jgi:hypothetical protein
MLLWLIFPIGKFAIMAANIEEVFSNEKKLPESAADVNFVGGEK